MRIIKVKTVITTVLLYITQSFTIMAVNQEMVSDSLSIFSPKRTYSYIALFIDAKGDTLSKENILIRPTGQPWDFDDSQTAIKISYNYTNKDSLTFLSHINPTTKRIKKPKKYSWYKNITTGAVESDERVWMHPIRDNQYNYTEVAPYPEVHFDSLKIGGNWRNKIIILMGWGAFNGTVNSDFVVVKNEPRQYGNLIIDDCWLIESVANHSKLGKSYLDFYFHPTYGFVEMNYRFFDGTKISFVLISDKSQLP